MRISNDCSLSLLSWVLRSLVRTATSVNFGFFKEMWSAEVKGVKEGLIL